MNIITEIHDDIFVVSINRPERRNAVDRDTADALASAFRSFDEDDSLKVAVLTGEGGYFCAGADLAAVSEGKGNRLDTDGDGPMGPSRMALSKPVIAAIAGYAVAGGIELACWCDLRVVEESAVMGVFCRRFGVPLIDGGTIRLPRLIGMSHAMDLILTGRPVKADEALKMGLANRVVADGQAKAAALELAKSIAGHPQACMRNDRTSAYEQWDMDVPAALENEFRLGMETISSGETLDGAKRFTEGSGRHGKF